MAIKKLSKQQWNSLPAYKKYQMKANTPDLYNYYQKRYEPKVEPVAEKRTIEAEQEPGLERLRFRWGRVLKSFRI
jgi:hypothetical protein